MIPPAEREFISSIVSNLKSEKKNYIFQGMFLKMVKMLRICMVRASKSHMPDSPMETPSELDYPHSFHFWRKNCRAEVGQNNMQTRSQTVESYCQTVESYCQ
jgi:hypothetical protein